MSASIRDMATVQVRVETLVRVANELERADHTPTLGERQILAMLLRIVAEEIVAENLA